MSGDDFTLEFDRATGTLASMRLDGRELLLSGPAPNFWRAPTDNDYGSGMPVRSGVWKRVGRPPSRHLDSMTVAVASASELRPLTVTSHFSLRSIGARYTLSHEVRPDGTVAISAHLHDVHEDLPEMPRFGTILTLPGHLDQVEWYGRGPHENYWDRRTGAAVARYTAPVSELAHPYVRPQETGTRSDTRWVAVTDGSGTGLLVRGLPTVSFSALPYTLEDLDAGEQKAGRHWADLVPRDDVTLTVDYLQQGVGGDDSWGAVAGRSLALDHFGEVNKVEHLARGRPVDVEPASSSRYSAAGDAGLVDGVRGSIDRRGGHWQGYQADEVTAVIQLVEGAEAGAVPVEAVKIGFLQHPGSGVYWPRRAEVAVSEDGVVFGEAVEGVVGAWPRRRSGEAAAPPEGGRLYVNVPLGGRTARAIRVTVQTFGAVPDSWPSGGSRAWTYIDEIIVR